MSGAPISPGELITIYGSNLADAPQSNTTQVFLGSQSLAPPLYSRPGQLNVQVPYDVPLNRQYQIAVQRDSMLSVPDQLLIAAAQPGIFIVNQRGQGAITLSDGVTLAQPGTPAGIGETVVIYCASLGAVSPSGALEKTVNSVGVSMGGQTAQVSFSGLTPGFVGLYQVNAVVPNVASGNAVPVVLTVASQTSPAALMAVK